MLQREAPFTAHPVDSVSRRGGNPGGNMDRVTSRPASALIRSSIRDDGDVNSLVRSLRDLYYGSGIGLMLRVGELILERLYGGDTTRWQSRGRKDVSFRKLEKHPDL